MFFSSTDQIMNNYRGGGEVVEPIGDGVNKPFRGEITSIHHGEKYSTCIIDRAVRVICLNSKFYEAKQGYWNQERVKGNVLAMGGAAIALEGASLFLSMPVRGGALVISGLYIACSGWHKAAEASRELSTWKTTLVDRVTAQRKRGDDFEFIFNNQLKGSVFHPEEVKRSWFQAVEGYLRSFRGVNLIADDVDRFFTDSPLGGNRREYAEGEFEQENIQKRLFICFDKALCEYNKINLLASQSREKFRHDCKDRIRRRGKKYQAEINEILFARDSGLAKIEAKRRRSVEELKSSIEKIIKAYFSPETRVLYGRKKQFLFALKRVGGQIGASFSSYPKRKSISFREDFPLEAAPVATLVAEGGVLNLPVAVRCREGDFSPCSSVGGVTPLAGDRMAGLSNFIREENSLGGKLLQDSIPSAPPLSPMASSASGKFG